MTGLSHFDQSATKKAQSYRTPGFVLFRKEEDGGDGQSPEGVFYESLKCDANV